MIEAIPTVPSTETQDSTTFRETHRSFEDHNPSTSKDTVPFIKDPRSSICNRMTILLGKETPRKILEIRNLITKLSRWTVKQKQFACVLTSRDNVHKKPANPNLIKEAAKKMKLAGTSASLSLQQIYPTRLKTAIMCALSAGKIIS